jgi:hypothetical protein
MSTNQMQFTVKKLPTRGPRKGELWQRQSQHGTGSALGNVKESDRTTGDTCAGMGKGVTLTKVGGIGKTMISDLSATVSRANAQYKADRRAAALDRLQEKAGY